MVQNWYDWNVNVEPEQEKLELDTILDRQFLASITK
jgi:hypothetical protein